MQQDERPYHAAGRLGQPPDVLTLRRTGDEGALACPCCGSCALHHGKIVAYERREDAPRVLRIEIDGGEAKLEWVVNDSRNPSARRNGLCIEFYCENCDCYSELTFAQHKGETLLGRR